MGCAGSKAPHQPFEDETTAPPPARNADGGDVVPESYVVSESIEPTMTRKSSHAEISMQFGADDYSGMRTFDVGGGAVKPSDNPAHVAHRTATRRASYEPDLPPMPDSFLDRYKLGETLGSGSFSIVRACTRRADGGQFAVKVMDTSDWEDSDMDDLMEECRNLTELEHPNIVQIVEMVQEANMVYLVTERCVGGELVDRIIERSHFSETDARDTVLLVLKAVHFCHERDVVHRDLKLENVLLTSTATQSSVKLVDFGFSKKIQDGASGTLETPCGTLRFCAPEILSNQSYGKKVDVWGIGCIAFCLLCGFPPFYDDNDAALTRKIQRGEFDFDAEVWDSVSDLGKEVVTWMLTVDPAGRPTSADLLQHNWFTAAEITGADPAGLLDSVRNLRSMVARRKFRAAVKAVVAMNRMCSLSNFGSAEETAAAVATVSASAGATSDEISTGSSTDSAESGGGLSPRKEKEKERRLSVDLGLSPEQAQDIFVIQEQVGVTPRRALEAYRAHGEDLTETVMSLFDEGEMERTAAASPSPVAAALPQGGGGECSDVESPAHVGGATSQHHDGEQQSSTQMPPALIMTAAKGKSTTRVTLEVRAAAQLLTRTCVTVWRSHSLASLCMSFVNVFASFPPA